MAQLRINTEIIKDIKLVIFDKDGTLMDLYNYWSNMVVFRVDLAQKRLGFDKTHRKDIMYAMGVDFEKGRLRSEGPVGLKKREIVMQAMIDSLAMVGYSDTYNLCYEIFKEADKLSLNHFSEIVKPIDGMHKLVNDLREKGCKIAIATIDKSERANLAMKFLGILDKIDIVAGEDMVERCKPAPDMVYMILNRTGIPQENAVMVGDAITDVEMGLNAGLKASIGVCSGLTSKEELLKKTRYVIEDVAVIMVL